MKGAWKILLGGVLLSATAQAKEVHFFFDVNSSGPEIYPCDAGIYHPPQKEWCHYKGTKKSCDKKDFGKPSKSDLIDAISGKVIKAGDKAHACICDGSVGSYRKDYLIAEVAKWKGKNTGWHEDGQENHLGWSKKRKTIKIAADNEEVFTVAGKLWKTGAKDVEAEFKTQLEKVTFNLGSELYGTHYFVDFCYKGSQIEYFHDHVKAPHSTEAYLSTTELRGKKRSYVKMAKPKVVTTLVCDQQGKGKYQYAHNGNSYHNGYYDQFETDIKDKGRVEVPEACLDAPGGRKWVGNLETKDEGGFYESSYIDLAKAPQKNTIIPFQFINHGRKSPRRCKLRLYICEQDSRPKKYSRAWQRHDARFHVKWKVEEDAE